jgi:hypothetical protein
LLITASLDATLRTLLKASSDITTSKIMAMMRTTPCCADLDLVWCMVRPLQVWMGDGTDSVMAGQLLEN